MLDINIPPIGHLIKEVTAAAKKSPGIIIVSGNNQNWNTYVALETCSDITSTLGKSVVGVSTVDTQDQYKPDWLEVVAPESLSQDTLVWAGALRDTEKGSQLIELAKNHLVLCIMHVPGGSKNIIERLVEMGCAAAEDHVLAILSEAA